MVAGDTIAADDGEAPASELSWLDVSAPLSIEYRVVAVVHRVTFTTSCQPAPCKDPRRHVMLIDHHSSIIYTPAATKDPRRR
jgi:hypothetical protein